jgi:pimeloyl-ACP methyl ester carboxylesterase
VPIEFARANLGTEARNPILPATPILDAMKATRLPILHIAGDHDIAFPVENWQALGRELPTLRLLTFPHAGHGPHHQYPEEAAAQIAAFIRTAS